MDDCGFNWLVLIPLGLAMLFSGVAVYFDIQIRKNLKEIRRIQKWDK